jgi:hypothetical protein
VATTPGLRPLGLGEILDVGIKLYLRNWRTLIACVVWVVLPVQILSVLLTLSIAPEQLDITSTETIDPGDEDAFLASQGIVALLQGVVYLLSTAACFKAVADAYLGSTPAAGRSLSFALRRLPGLIWLGVVLFAALALALVALIIPSIWLGVAWSLAVPALLFERTSAFGALRRSYRLVKGNWWKTALTLLVGVFLVSFLAGIIQALLLLVAAVAADGSDAVNAFANVVASTAGSVLTTPFTSAVVTLIYFDRRVRKEGFDLRLLAEGLGEERDPDAPLPGPGLLEPEVTDEQRAAAPYWPPPPGWTPPEPSSPPPGGWSPPTAPQSEPPPSSDAPAEPPERGEGSEGGEGDGQPPQAPHWPPDSPSRGPGGL